MVKSLTTKEYGLMALIALLISIGLLVYYVHETPYLEPSALNRVYYIVLLPAAVASAVALFGVLRGYARLVTKHPGVAIELGGPAALFLLVLLGGFQVTRSEAGTFDLTVRAKTSEETAPIIQSGAITIDLDNDRRTASLNSKGEADFKGIPSKFQGTEIRILAQIANYKERWVSRKISGNVLYITLDSEGPILFRGFVHDESGNPVPEVHVESTDCNNEATTNNSGIFAFDIQPGARTQCHLIFRKDGYASYCTDVAIDRDPDHRFLIRRIRPGFDEPC